MCAVALVNVSSRTSVDPSKPAKDVGARVLHEGPAVSPEEWTEIEGWMKVNCPNRLNVLGKLGDAQGQKEHAKQLMAEQYRQIKRTSYKPLQDALVQQAQAQDLIFEAQLKLREARREKESPAKQIAKLQLKAAVGKLFDAEVQEKSARVGHLELEIDHMRKNRTTMVDDWTKREMKRVDPSLPGTGSTVPDPASSSPGVTGSSSSPTE